jgi:hypothetical protein
MSRSWQALMGVGAGLLVAGYALSIVGCSGAPTESAASSRPGPAQLKEGLNILEASNPKWGFNAAYMKSGRVVYVESRMGSPKPEVYRQGAPDEPPNEMDYRFVDQAGHTFYVVRGGDLFVDPSWAAEVKGSWGLDKDAYAQRDGDFALAQEAAAELHLQLPTEFKDHAFHMDVFSKLPLPSQDPQIAERAKTIQGKLPVDAEYGTYAGYATDVTLNAKAIVCALWVCAASHSATQTGYWYTYQTQSCHSCSCSWWSCKTCCSTVTNTAFAGELVSCNHGTCANGMSYQCESVVANNSANITGSTTGSIDGANDGQGGCQTAYNWDSGGADHLCNDDSAYELWQGKNGNQGSDGQWGTGGGPNTFQWYGSSHCMGSACGQSPSYFACTCNTFGGCAGDWNAPWCP